MGVDSFNEIPRCSTRPVHGIQRRSILQFNARHALRPFALGFLRPIRLACSDASVSRQHLEAQISAPLLRR